jgi:hypothetical protein
MHFHLIQAGGDLEQDGGLKGSRNSLADINIARYHHAINWRFDRGVAQINLHLAKLRDFLFSRRNGGFHLRVSGTGGGASRQKPSTSAGDIRLSLRHGSAQPVSGKASAQGFAFRAYAAGSQFSRTCGFNFGIAQAGLSAR